MDLNTAIDEFYEVYEVYRKLQKHMKIRMHTHFAQREDGYIEIWQYRNNAREKLLVKVTAEAGEPDAEAQCYEKAADFERDILREQEEQQDQRAAG